MRQEGIFEDRNVTWDSLQNRKDWFQSGATKGGFNTCQEDKAAPSSFAKAFKSFEVKDFWADIAEATKGRPVKEKKDMEREI